jgi:hypothetical protein
MNKVVVAIAFVFFSILLKAQNPADSLKVVTPSYQDTTVIKAYAARYNPDKASLYAAVLPGLGQIYNKKYWKLPLVYGGIGAIGYGINYYQGLYKDYKEELFYILETGEPRSLENHTEAQLRPAIDQARRERDFMIILMGGMYILQIIDAHVDAHLKEFDVNPNLQVKIRPAFENDVMIGRQMGVSLTITF